MSRRGGRPWNQPNNTRFSGGSYSDEHDDHDRKQQATKRRVSFKPSGAKGRAKNRMELAVKTRLEDDEEMADSGINKVRIDWRRRGSPIPRGRVGGLKKLLTGMCGWYQVSIPFGQKYDKNVIIRSILGAIAPDIFVPHYWRQDKNCVTFYLDDLKMAERMMSIDRTISLPDGYKMCIKVRSGVPLVNVDDTLKERMKLAMAKRYNAATNALDLSKFHADPDLKDVFCGLFRPAVMLAVIDIVSDNIPHLEALNLNENQIQQLDHFKCLQDKLPHIKILYLADNRIYSIAALQAFKGLSIIELALKNNPFKNRYRSEQQCISEIRKKFPKLVKLDGQVLEPLIVFDVQDTISLPTAKASFLCDASGADIIRQFIEQYFIIFDSENRQPLLDAYHEQAMLSMTLPSANQTGKLSNYWPYNRNILRLHDTDSKSRLLRFGRLPCVSLLSELPKTQHDPQSFSVDLSLFTPKLICFTVAGVFKELSTTSEGAIPELRFFQRQFIVVPTGSGFCIRNEMIFISNPTQLQSKTAFKPAAAQPAAVVSPAAPVGISAAVPIQAVPSTSQATTSTSINPGGLPDEATKMQMIQAMSTQSNMNIEWSRKCLEETNWDFNHAVFAFNKLHKENRIPPEAFQRK